ncbi:hypothetical protein P153DRAFT_363200 [Dothidotthia symphoricarpi CBS 119687]|uniref:Pre-mRNA-splicing factor n=1 Tax=Dothidotthia symphoricarpi CBS 119687 TaxID=1392245 RepID=A0A6A6ASM6_9PLEO|nr:uncharacterized protein P153DRAFT_363200 [Dothidotthia symphoricarpi CBS 119687]KAF2134223.1 hypothetical protein P153DRAFT_363200 [Dothidotthia symphoricarpi CBS 119687]
MAAPKQGGFKMSLGGLKAKPGLKASLLQKEAKRPRLALGDDEPDDSIKQQEISGWDAAEGGALDASGKTEKKGPRIIPAQSNRNWREEARRKQLARAAPKQAQNEATVGNMEEPEVQYGLTIVKKKEEPQEDMTTSTPAESGEPMDIDENDGLTTEQRLEKKALDALLNGKSTDEEHVIPVQTEEENLYDDLRDAPDAPTLEAYEATPIEGFGAALLRGMGWKDGEGIGRNGTAPKPKEVKRRPALLGIGAKEEAATGVELGEWGIKAKGKGKKATQTYNPVTLRNKHTGELITEEELKVKLQNQDMVPEEKPEKARSKYDEDDEDERRREKRRAKRDDGDRRRDDDYDSERRRDKNRKDDRRRDRESDYHDSDRRRDKRREKDRDDDYDSERRSSKRDGRDSRKDRDRRDRSRSPDDRREKKRDRYRSRSRDSEDRRDKRRERDRRERSRSRDSEDRRKRTRERESGYDDDRVERKRRYVEEKSYRK